VDVDVAGDRRGRLEVKDICNDGLEHFTSLRGRQAVEDFAIIKRETSSRPRDRPDDRRWPLPDKELLPITIWRLGGQGLVACKLFVPYSCIFSTYVCQTFGSAILAHLV